MYNTQINMARKWHGFSVGITNDVVVVWVVDIDSVGIKIDLVLCGDPKWLGLESALS